MELQSCNDVFTLFSPKYCVRRYLFLKWSVETGNINGEELASVSLIAEQKT